MKRTAESDGRRRLAPVRYDPSHGRDILRTLDALAEEVRTAVLAVMERPVSVPARASELVALIEKFDRRYADAARYHVMPMALSVHHSVYEGVRKSLEELTGRPSFSGFLTHDRTVEAAKRVADWFGGAHLRLFDRIAGELVREAAARDRKGAENAAKAVESWAADNSGRALNYVAHVTSAATADVSAAFGIDGYVWVTRRDGRVVGNPSGIYPVGNREHGDHWRRHGKVFRWAEPPHDGHPGQAPNCRCVAAPLI